MSLNHYIFLTDEGYPFQTGSENDFPDIENLQVIGLSSGASAGDAFMQLLSENERLKDTSSGKVFCYKLDKDYESSKEYFYMYKLDGSKV